MRKRTFATIVSVLLILIFVTVGRVASKSNEVETIVSPTSSPDISPTITPTPPSQEVAGKVEEIGETVSYKNSTLARVNGNTVYITDETRVVDAFDEDVDRDNLTEGTMVIVEGVPVEGGLEASRIIVVLLEETPTSSRAPRKPTATPEPAV